MIVQSQGQFHDASRLDGLHTRASTVQRDNGDNDRPERPGTLCLVRNKPRRAKGSSPLLSRLASLDFRATIPRANLPYQK